MNKEQACPEYTCASCGGTFRSTWTDEEAHAEAARDFGLDAAKDPVAVLCEKCYQEMKADVRAHPVKYKGLPPWKS